MKSLKLAMAWDERNYGREYDLDIFMIVAVSDFNMGAMENKGLNIFNSKFVLARPESATDRDFQGIEGVIAHEYFHNWTGNRITCRDWFQLSLKEGLTVFRDQEFSADMGSRGLNNRRCAPAEIASVRRGQRPYGAPGKTGFILKSIISTRSPCTRRVRGGAHALPSAGICCLSEGHRSLF